MHASLVLKLDQHLVYVDVERSRCDSPNGVMTAKIATLDEECCALVRCAIRLVPHYDLYHIIPARWYGFGEFSIVLAIMIRCLVLGEPDLQKDRLCRLSPR
jgi:hypothetical protein